MIDRGGVRGADGAAVRLVTAGLALLVALVATSAPPPPAFAQHRHDGAGDAAGERPDTFAKAVRLIGDALEAIESSRRTGDLGEVAGRATRLLMLAGSLPALAEAPPAALAGAALAEVAEAGDRLATAAQTLLDAASRGDHPGIARASERLAGLHAALDAHVVRSYVCPMRCEPGRIQRQPGACPVCAMALKLVTSDRYGVDVVPVSGVIRAGRPTTLAFRIRDPAGFDVTDLQVVHEKLLHLIVVSEDLSWFDHLHPERQEDGRFRLTCRFPVGGRYTLFHDFTPATVGMQVVPVELTVQGRSRAPVPLEVDDRAPKRVHGYQVKLTHSALAPDLGCGFAFWLSRGGRPVTDLEPFLGAMGHLVIVSQDRQAYIHSHPLDPNATRGPVVEFGMGFPKTGRYKAWGQFGHRGRVLTVPFVVEVTATGHEDEDEEHPAEGSSGP
jgi:heavy metal-binding protein